jgi:hypothetical protein
VRRPHKAVNLRVRTRCKEEKRLRGEKTSRSLAQAERLWLKPDRTHEERFFNEMSTSSN